MAKKKLSEVDLAKHVVTWLKEEGWDVYEEVSLGYASAADIIAVRKPVVAAIEVKTSMSLAVIGQAKRWMGQAHLVYVAVPDFERGSAQDGAEWVCKLLGLGLLTVHRMGGVYERVRPEFRRKVKADKILSKLNARQQDGSIPAGSTSGARWTPWRMTVENLTAYVRSNPGVTLKEALGKVGHHYRSDKAARSSISQQIRTGVLKGIRAVPGKEVTLFPAEDTV